MNRLKFIFVVVFFMTSFAFSQNKISDEKFIGIWQMIGSRPENSQIGLFRSDKMTFLKAFFQDKTFQNLAIVETVAVVNAEGTFEVVDGSHYNEHILKSNGGRNDNMLSKLTYQFISDNELKISFGVPGSNTRIEEYWLRVRVPSAYNSENQAKKELPAEDVALFADPMFLKLNKKVSQKQIEAISNPELKSLATQLAKKTYKTDHRVAEFTPILSPRALGKQLHIGDGYSKFEQITGIYLPEGEQIIAVNNIPEGKEVGLIIPDWTRRAPEGVVPDKDPAGWGIKRQTFPLKNGTNLINLQKGGLAYISYFTDDINDKTPIKVHFINGKVNGYFDLAKHNNNDWNKLIDNAVYPIIDAVGKHIQIAYPTEACKKYAYGKGVELIKNYDLLVARQYEIMGLKKYNRIPKNRILSRVNYNYYMFRDGDGVAYMGTQPGYAMAMVVTPEKVIKGDPCWGFSHEVGHVHQLAPYFNWGGMAEVSNNIFSLYVTLSFGNKSRLLAQDNYKKAQKEIVERKISFLQDPDVFNRLVPFWQLHLYFTGAGQNPDFYPDLFEAFRQQGDKENKSNSQWHKSRGENPAVYQLNFVKTVCAVSKTDLTDFFDKYGFFYVGEITLNDYGTYVYRMTQAMVDECKKEIQAMNLPKPKVDISTLTD